MKGALFHLILSLVADTVLNIYKSDGCCYMHFALWESHVLYLAFDLVLFWEAHSILDLVELDIACVAILQVMYPRQYPCSSSYARAFRNDRVSEIWHGPRPGLV